MADVLNKLLKKAFGEDVDEKVALQNARALADLLESKMVPNKKVILDELYFPYKISAHTNEYYCFVFVSDVSYCFTANRRSRTPCLADFFVSLKATAPHMFANVRVPNVSKQLGVDVFRQCFCKGKDITTALSSKRMRDILKKISFSRISQFHLSPIQLSVIASLDFPQSCVEQAFVFQSLMTVVIEEACERHRDRP